MTIIQCPKCLKTYEVKDNLANYDQIKCRNCDYVWIPQKITLYENQSGYNHTPNHIKSKRHVKKIILFLLTLLSIGYTALIMEQTSNQFAILDKNIEDADAQKYIKFKVYNIDSHVKKINTITLIFNGLQKTYHVDASLYPKEHYEFSQRIPSGVYSEPEVKIN